MKTILIVSHGMEIGGVERSLLGLLDSINYKEYQVDLFLYRHTGELMKYIPSSVHLLPEIAEYASLAIPMETLIKRKQLKILSGRLEGKFKAKIFDKKFKTNESGVALEYSHKYTKKYLPEIGEGKEYNLAISFLTPHYFVNEKVKAKIKVAWIHTDYSNISVNKKSELLMWNKYDKIVSISDKCTESFINIFPELGDKVIKIENILSKTFINNQADIFSVRKEMPKLDNGFNLLSVGRFATPKNFENIPEICKFILESGHMVRWYLIGYGNRENAIKMKIKELGLQEHVIILGKKENPYPYIKACDIYVQPSLFEGKAVTVREAQILCKPVVITDFFTAKSQLIDGYDGIIVPLKNSKCAEGIIKFIKNSKLRRKIIKNCQAEEYDNQNEVKRIYKLMEESYG